MCRQEKFSRLKRQYSDHVGRVIDARCLAQLALPSQPVCSSALHCLHRGFSLKPTSDSVSSRLCESQGARHLWSTFLQVFKLI